MKHSARAKRYAKNVVAGKVVAGEFVRLACQRHLDDLKAQRRKSFPFKFVPAAADRVCQFIELLPHVKGRWLRRGELIRLEDWQCFLVCVPFGWLRKSNDLRRFRRAYTEVARKNAKSTLSAAVGIYMFTNDGEYGAEVLSGATTEKQAWEVFGPARLMVRDTADLRNEFGVTVNAKNLHILASNSKFEPIVGNPGDGASPSFAIIDEYHEHTTDEQYDTMLTGMGAREQAMAWVITTAGSDTSGPCYSLRTEAVNVLRGNFADEELFALIYAADEGDDWTSKEALLKANPNYDVSVSGDYLQSQLRIAMNNPRKQATFKTKHQNIWVGAGSPFFNLENWNQLADPTLRLEDFAGEACTIGLDLASKLDLAAYVRLFVRDVDGELHYYAFLNAYLPEDRAAEPGLDHYMGWSIDGDLITTPRSITDYDVIEADLLNDSEEFRITSLGFDPYNATHIVTHLMNAGIECVEIPQTVRHLSEPMKWVEALIEDGRLHHDGNPVFSWAIGNVTAHIDRNDNVFPRKERRENKIDPAVALIIAMNRAHGEEEDVPSVYETRGLISI